MADMTVTQAMAHAPSTANKTALIAAIQAVLDAIDTAVTDTVSGTAQVSTVAISGTPTGGTYTLTFVDSIHGTRTTSALAFNASAAAVQTAIRLLAGLSLATVTASGTTPNFTHTITFKGNQAAITVSRTLSLTGGSPVVTIATPTAYAQLPAIGANSAVLIKNKLVDWAEDLASVMKE
jgi:hypothetical protein